MCIYVFVHAHVHMHTIFGIGICIFGLFNDSCSASVSLSSNDRLIGDILLESVVREFKVQVVK